jgi:hypothetical protein
MSMTTLWALLVVGGFAIQPPGQFHGDEPIAHDGESWLALHVDGNEASLVATTLKVRAVRDELFDETDALTGLEISSPDDDRVIAYLQGTSLRPGMIEAAAVASMDQGAAGLPYELTFRDQLYHLSSHCEQQSRDVHAQQPQFDCRIELRTGGHAQVLSKLTGYRENQAATMSLGDDASPVLIFAGDLDRDGKLDLIFNTTDHYNVSRPTLFLSSQSKSGELLHEVARYESIGC